MWTNPLGILATDCDGDGLDDLVTATPRMLRLFRPMGPGADFELSGYELMIDAEPRLLVDHYVEIVFAGLDGDATRPELVVLRHDSTSGVELRTHRLVPGASRRPPSMRSTSGPTRTSRGATSTATGTTTSCLFDPDGSYQVLRQGPTGQLTVEPRAAGGPATHLADIDQDGDLDGICCGGGAATLAAGPHLDALGAPEPGETRYCQCWFRDPEAPGGAPGSTAGVRVTFSP